jgi:hypothetical protein
MVLDGRAVIYNPDSTQALYLHYRCVYAVGQSPWVGIDR